MFLFLQDNKTEVSLLDVLYALIERLKIRKCNLLCSDHMAVLHRLRSHDCQSAAWIHIQ